MQVFGEPFHEYTHAEEGEAVMGKEYEGELQAGNVSALLCPRICEPCARVVV